MSTSELAGTAELLTERPADGVAVLRINRPQVHNALNRDLIGGLADAVGNLSHAGSVRALVITGTGAKAFSA